MVDVIVIGLGGVGSQAAWQLARRNVNVLGIDRFAPPHDRGSSHGETRLIRQAYFEHPDYVPLLLRAYSLWRELQNVCGQKLLFETGLLEVGPTDGTLITGIRRSAREHQLPIEELSPMEASRRFPGFRWPATADIVFEPTGGYLRVEECVRAALSAAQAEGATLRANETVLHWYRDGNSYVVETDAGRYSASRLLLAGGAWASDLLASLRLPLRVVRKSLHWFEADDPRYDENRGCPCFLCEVTGRYFYGFPVRDGLGLKVAEHSGGEEIPDPLTVDRRIRLEETESVRAFLREHLPGVEMNETQSSVCLYTKSPDEHFIVDKHPDFPEVAFAAGLSGHGFKFASVLGEILADVVLGENPRHPISFLSVHRFRH